MSKNIMHEAHDSSIYQMIRNNIILHSYMNDHITALNSYYGQKYENEEYHLSLIAPSNIL
jgi:hypothetical protein